jgi:hypothetical protein
MLPAIKLTADGTSSGSAVSSLKSTSTQAFISFFTAGNRFHLQFGQVEAIP